MTHNTIFTILLTLTIVTILLTQYTYYTYNTNHARNETTNRVSLSNWNFPGIKIYGISIQKMMKCERFTFPLQISYVLLLSLAFLKKKAFCKTGLRIHESGHVLQLAS